MATAETPETTAKETSSGKMINGSSRVLFILLSGCRVRISDVKAFSGRHPKCSRSNEAITCEPEKLIPPPIRPVLKNRREGLGNYGARLIPSEHMTALT